jgi:hypothetical protein
MLLDREGKPMAETEKLARIVKLQNPPARVSRKELQAKAKEQLGQEVEAFYSPATNRVSDSGAIFEVPARVELLNPPDTMSDKDLEGWLAALPPPEKTEDEEMDEMRITDRARRKAELEDLLSDSIGTSQAIKSSAQVEDSLTPRIEALESSSEGTQALLQDTKTALEQGSLERSDILQKLDKMTEVLINRIGAINVDLDAKITALDARIIALEKKPKG